MLVLLFWYLVWRDQLNFRILYSTKSIKSLQSAATMVWSQENRMYCLWGMARDLIILFALVSTVAPQTRSLHIHHFFLHSNCRFPRISVLEPNFPLPLLPSYRITTDHLKTLLTSDHSCWYIHYYWQLFILRLKLISMGIYLMSSTFSELKNCNGSHAKEALSHSEIEWKPSDKVLKRKTKNEINKIILTTMVFSINIKPLNKVLRYL